MQTITRFSEVTAFDARTAWEQWNLTEYSFKSECLLSVSKTLYQIDATLSNVMVHHIQQAQFFIGEPQLMPGPTGETNELYCAGRGVCALVVTSLSEQKEDVQKAAISLLTAALIAGNSVVICCDDEDFNHTLEQALGDYLPAHLVQIVAYDSYAKLIESNISIAAVVVDPQTQITMNRLLAQRTGAIVPLIMEDPQNIALSFDPALVLRFITERTRTINITAVGGNATLLELGSEH